jgi:Mg2+-importing ATPase
MRADTQDRTANFCWSQPSDALLLHLNSDPDGLSSTEAAARLESFGPNVLRVHSERALVLQFLSRFRNPLVILLLAASVVSAFTGDVTSFIIISVIVLMSVALDFIQEYRAGQAAERLKKTVAVHARVLRDGQSRDIPIDGLAPGDVVLLAAGDLIPADARLLEARDFFVKQALLTGEPYPVEKRPGEIADPAAGINDASNTVFMGTSVISGSAKALVCRTGSATALGEIADTLATKAPPTDFEQGTQQFGMLIMRLTILLVLFVLLELGVRLKMK